MLKAEEITADLDNQVKELENRNRILEQFIDHIHLTVKEHKAEISHNIEKIQNLIELKEMIKTREA